MLTFSGKFVLVALTSAFILTPSTCFVLNFQSVQSTNISPNNTIKVIVDKLQVSCMGHEVLEIIGIDSLDPAKESFCLFNDPKNPSPSNKVKATIITLPDLVMICPIPYLYSFDINVEFIVEGDKTTYKSDLSVEQFKWDIFADVTLIEQDGSLIVSLQWDLNLFNPDDKLELVLVAADPLWIEMWTVKSNLENSGQFNFIWTSINIPDLPDIFTLQIRSYWSEVSIFSNILVGLSTIPDPLVAQYRCKGWYEQNNQIPNYKEHCPPLLSLAVNDKRFEEEIYTYPKLEYYHPGAFVSYRQLAPNYNGAGSQCVYSKDGNIIVGQPSCGTADMSSPENSPDMLGHLRDDILPWTICCKESESDLHCRHYFKRRPCDSGSEYIRPETASCIGDPHMFTFDGVKYDFMGHGEFWLIKMVNNNFALQGRMQPIFVSPSVTGLTAYAMDDGFTRVQVDTPNGNSVVRVDGQIVSILNQIKRKTVKIERVGENKIIASFSTGFFISMEGNMLVVSAFQDNKGKLAGLLGDFDSNVENDLRAPDGTITFLNASRQEIYDNFGLPWMITKEESLFVYDDGFGFENFSHPEFGANFDEPDYNTIPVQVKEMCGDNKECLYDFAMTNDTQVANQTKQQQDELTELEDQLDETVIMCRGISDSNIQNGYVVATNFLVGSTIEFVCYEGYQLEGKQYISCILERVSARWSNNIPKCTPIIL